MRRVVWTLAFAGALLGAQSAGADQVVAPVGGPIDASGAHLAYSLPDGKRFRLVIDGRTAPIAASARPFDVDLGTSARGRLVAVYTRGRGRRDVVWLDVESGRERRVPGASHPRRTEATPSVSRGRVLFTTSGPRAGLAMVSLTGGHLTELPVPRVGLSVDETELAGGVLAFRATEYDADNPDNDFSQLWFSRIGRTPKLLFRSQNTLNRRTDINGMGVSSRWVSTALSPQGDSFDNLTAIRVSPSRGRVQRASLPDVPNAPIEEEQRSLEGFASSDDRTYTAACLWSKQNATDCRLVRTELKWRLSRR